MAQNKAPKMHIEGAAQASESEEAARSTATPAQADAPRVDAAEKRANQANATAEASKKKPAVHIASSADEPAAGVSEAAPRNAAPDADGSTTHDAPKPRNPYEWVSRAVPGHEHAVLGGIAGLVIALLIFLVGIWQTVFVTLLVCAGVAFGQYLDGDPKIINLLRRFLAGGTGDE